MSKKNLLRPVVYQPPKIVLATDTTTASEPETMAAASAAAPRSSSANRLTPVVYRPLTVAPEYYSKYDEMQKKLPGLPLFNGAKRFVWIQEDKSSRAKPANAAKRYHVNLLASDDNDKNRAKMIRAWGRSAVKEGVLFTASWNPQNCWLVISSLKTVAQLNDHVREFWKQYDKDHDIDEDGFTRDTTATEERRTEAADSGSGDKKRHKSNEQK